MEQKYYKSEVLDVISESTNNIQGKEVIVQKLKLKVLEGPQKDKVLELEHGKFVSITEAQKTKEGDILILSQTQTPQGETTISIYDTYRLENVVFIIFLFAALVILVAGRKGLGALVGMGVSLATIFFFIVPQILNGQNPVFISILGSIFIMLVTLFATHGPSKKTIISLVSISISLVIAGLLSIVFVNLAKLTGLGNEETYSLLQLKDIALNTKGLLLGGIIIASLGVLDDAAVTQVSTLFEISKANAKLKFFDLLERGFKVGRDHIASIVNTLVLAYAGSSIALFLIFVLNPTNQPYWVILNSEVITEEIIRTLAGTMGIILAVPITTFVAAYYLTKLSKSQ
jgi:uncharacterized membrane protein